MNLILISKMLVSIFGCFTSGYYSVDLISVISDLSFIMSQSGEKKDAKRSSSGKDKDKDSRLLAEMSKEPVAPNQELVELVNKLGGRQAEVLRKEFSQGQAAMKDEVKNLTSVMSNIEKTLQELKEIPG